MELCISNIAPEVTREELRRYFEEYGEVASFSLKRAKGMQGEQLIVGFVEMPLRDEALSAMKALNGRIVKGLPISVIETTAKEEKEMAHK